jgi:uncharacterized membrane protein
MTSEEAGSSVGRAASLFPGLLLGLGLGGFIDGIVLHQLLQWHHMVSASDDHPADTVAGLEANTLADGLFHAGTWVLVILGMALMLRSWQEGRRAPSWRLETGLLLAGWGVFNVVEGLVNHHILGLHHVRDDLGGALSWDLGFLAFGVALIISGWAVHDHGARTRSPPSQVPTRRSTR